MARKMKDSGIEWIGEIPEGWSIARGKHILTLLQRAVFPTDGVITCFRDGEVTLRSNRREDGFTVSLKEIGYQGIEPGDLVVHGMDGFAGSIGISDSRGKSSPVLVVLDSSQDKKYLMYYLRSMAYNNVFLALSTGIRVRSCDLKWNKLADLLYLVPPIVKQHKLVSFLDEKCSEIDAMLSKTRASIEEYKKLKQAVITQAVTKGVRGEREMKDSGVEWIGKIPREFDPVQLKFFCKLITDGTHFSPTTVENGLPYITAGDVHGIGLDYNSAKRISKEDFQLLVTQGCQPLKGDVLLVKDGATTGRVGFVDSDTPCVILSSVAMLRPADNTDGHYLMYLLASDFLQKQILISMAGSAMPRTTLTKLTKYIGLLPPLHEQKEIANYLNAKCAEIDGLIAKKEQLVKELESYKKSLIYEVVTGKREV